MVLDDSKPLYITCITCSDARLVRIGAEKREWDQESSIASQVSFLHSSSFPFIPSTQTHSIHHSEGVKIKLRAIPLMNRAWAFGFSPLQFKIGFQESSSFNPSFCIQKQEYYSVKELGKIEGLNWRISSSVHQDLPGLQILPYTMFYA